MDNKKRFLDMHSSVLDSEFNLFCEEADSHSLEFIEDCERKTILTSVVNTQIEAISTMYELQKSALKAIELTPQEAVEIVSQKMKEDDVFSAQGVDGSDCYRFMNNELKMNRKVALAAYENNSSVARHFPKALQEQLKGKDIGKTLKSMALSDDLDKMFYKSSKKQSLSGKMTI